MVAKIVVVVVGLLVVGVALGAGYFLLAPPPPVTPPGTAPTVTAVSPLNAATGVAINSNIAATFSQAMNASTITTSTFTLKQGATSVAGVVTYAGTQATFDPSSALAASTTFVATVTTGVKNTAGLALAANFVWNFTTGVGADNVPPAVTFVSPAASATGTAINAKVLATFSEAMDPSTVTGSTFLVTQGTTPVPGVVTYLTPTATFDPTGDFAASTLFTATISTGAKDLAGNALPSAYVWTFTTGAAADTTAPTVASTLPAADATGVALDVSVSATFSEAMDASTLTLSTFTLMQGTTPVAGIVSYASLTAIFNPSSDLSPSALYTAKVTTGAKDLAGNALATDRVWSFTTGTTVDTTAPTVVSTVPGVDATDVAVDINITATFSEAMDPTTITTTTFQIIMGTFDIVPGAVSYSGLTATFNPTSDLVDNVSFSIYLSAGAKDIAGNALVVFSGFFTTSPSVVPPDTTPPTVIVTSPDADEVGVAIDAFIMVTFSEAMNGASITGSSTSFTLMQGATPVSGVRSYDDPTYTASFDPVVDLVESTNYTATITTEALDLAGNALQADLVWNFTTAGPSCAQLTVDLGSAADFAVLAGSTVTNTGNTVINGDLGVSPGTAVTGFGPGVVNGNIHAGNTTAADAIANVTLAYNDAAGRTLCAVTVSGNLGGLTLTPGLYKSTSSLEISSGDLTLDALGDPNAVFIFQMASTLDVSAGLRVNLTGGAKASNVFWQVGTSATFGANATFVGTILADQSITFGTGVVLEGRALARIAAVGLDTCTITKPAP